MARVLVVDDDLEQLRLRCQMVALAGHEVAPASTAAEAVQLLDEFRPGVLLMDLRLPGLRDGLALIRAAAEQNPVPRIIVLSGWPDALDDRPERARVSCVLMKPAASSKLLAAIRELAAVFCCLLAAAGAMIAQSFPFTVKQPSEVVAELDMSSPGAAWNRPGREAALAGLSVDGRSSQHVMLYAGEERFTYRAFLGALAPGKHELRIARHPRYSAPEAGLQVQDARFREVPRGDPTWLALAHAPILYARADTVGGFTDIPLLAYCERLSEGGRQLLQYTVIFSNEDGGTSTRALMARWGRTTDIEYIYRAWLDASGAVERATIQAKDHKEVPFRGRREGSHPVLIPITRNNMVAAEGTSAIRYQIPPVVVDLAGHSREEVMDAQPIAYRVMAQELERERKLRPPGTVEGENVSDPRNYLYLELKLANRTAAVAAFARLQGETLWRSSHLGRGDYAIARDGWARTTIELPPGTPVARIAEFAFECLVPPAKPELPAGTCRLEAVSKVFQLGPDYAPGPAFWRLAGPVEMPTGVVRVFPAGAPARSLP